MPLHGEYFYGSNRRVAAPGDLVECMRADYADMKLGSVLRVRETCPSGKMDSNWSYRFDGLRGIYKGINFRLMEDKFTEDKFTEAKCTNGKEEQGMANQESPATDDPVIKRVYFMQGKKIVDRLLIKESQRDEAVRIIDERLAKQPYGLEAHVYEFYAVRKAAIPQFGWVKE